MRFGPDSPFPILGIISAQHITPDAPASHPGAWKAAAVNNYSTSTPADCRGDDASGPTVRARQPSNRCKVLSGDKAILEKGGSSSTERAFPIRH
jgi:hypothetical protein